MKQIFNLVALLLVSMAASGQYSYQKSATVLKQRMDSVEINYWNSYDEVWESSKYHYDYDVSGQMTFYFTTYTDNSSGDVLGEDRYEYSYNADGSIAELHELNWDEDAGDWETSRKRVYSYDEGGNQIGYANYNWDSSGEQWTRVDSTFNTYNGEGLLTEYNGFLWQSDQWIIRYFSQYNYEQHGWLSEHYMRMWYEADQTWKNNIKFVYTWNEQGEMLTKIRYDQEVYEGPWLEYYKLEHFYNDENLLTTTNSAHWETGQWAIYRTDTMSYNADGLLAEDRGYTLVDSSMQPDFRYEYSYDASGNLTEYINYTWDENTSNLVFWGKNLYSHDLSFSITDLLLPGVDSDWYSKLFLGNITSMPLGLHIYHWIDDSWQDYQKTAYFYSEMNVVGLGERELAMVRLYPNPVGDQLHIALPEGSSGATLALYEITGRQVFRCQMEEGAILSMANLPAGIYLYSLSVDGMIQSGKLVKR